MVVAVIPWVLSARAADAIAVISTIAAAAETAFAACIILASPLCVCPAGANDHRKAPGWQARTPQSRTLPEVTAYPSDHWSNLDLRKSGWRACHASTGSAACAAEGSAPSRSLQILGRHLAEDRASADDP